MSPTKVADALEKVKEANGQLKPLLPLEAVPITHGRRVKIDPNARYLVFISTEEFANMGRNFINDPLNPIPAGTPIYIVNDLDRAIKIYEILDTKVTNSGK